MKHKNLTVSRKNKRPGRPSEWGRREGEVVSPDDWIFAQVGRIMREKSLGPRAACRLLAEELIAANPDMTISVKVRIERKDGPLAVAPVIARYQKIKVAAVQLYGRYQVALRKSKAAKPVRVADLFGQALPVPVVAATIPPDLLGDLLCELSGKITAQNQRPKLVRNSQRKNP